MNIIYLSLIFILFASCIETKEQKRERYEQEARVMANLYVFPNYSCEEIFSKFKESVDLYEQNRSTNEEAYSSSELIYHKFSQIVLPDNIQLQREHLAEFYNHIIEECDLEKNWDNKLNQVSLSK